ncbi:MAG TPA: hypothetical protein VMD78_02025 [Candidatus Baltobacteraceae bacterium]|nr:hypothetical protein [Candidatus Baltobacteraceae bacterium]
MSKNLKTALVPSACWLALLIAAIGPCVAAQQSATGASSSASTSQKDSASPSHTGPIKLMLKDGSFELVREYQIKGDRIRYYDLDSSQWEEMPAALVDWDATKKVAAADAQRDSAILAKVHKQEEERRADPLDIDASLEAAPGVFLPSGVGLWSFDGHGMQPLNQAEIDSKLSAKQAIAKVMSPVPIVPTRHNIYIKGEHAAMRLRTSQPEFYMRTADGRTPEIRLIHAKVHGSSRYLEHVDELFNEQWESGNTVPMQRWEVAKGVFRFTLGEPLVPGEYVLAEVLQNEEMSFYVWDFGLDATADAKTK